MKSYCFLFVSILTVHNLSFALEDFYDIIYTGNTDGLYDQKVVGTEDYRQSNSTRKQQLLLDNFHRNQQTAYGQWVSSFLLSTMQYLSIPFSIIFAKKLLFSSPLESNSDAPAQAGFGHFASNLFLTLWAAFIYPIAWYFTEETTETITSVISSSRRWMYGAPNDTLHAWEEKYVMNKPAYSESWQKAIETNFRDARKKFRMRSQYLQRETGMDPHLLFAELALSLPIKSAFLHLDAAALKKNLRQYENMASVDGKNAVAQMTYFCESFAKANQNPHLRLPIYLYGAPGTGKTECVQLMADALNVPVIRINLADVKENGELRGISTSPGTGVGHPGLIAQGLIDLKKQGCDSKTVVVFFDNADMVLNRKEGEQINKVATFVLDLLEGKTKVFQNPYFNAELDVCHMAFILAGNSLLGAAALRDRVDTIYFGGYSLAYRKHQGRSRFLNAAIEDYSGILDRDNFTEEDLERIDRFAEEEHDRMTDSQIETEPGFRGQQRKIHRFVHEKAINQTEIKTPAIF
jgi:ATPase family associated with various cellular activities (AAA)